MVFHPFEVTIPHIAYAALGGFVVFFGMFSLFIREKLYIGEACWAFLFGVVIGPYGANIFDPRGWGNGDLEVGNEITLEVTRVVLAIGVFAIGVELPKAYMARHWKSLLILLGPVMTWGWFVSAGIIYALIPRLNFLSSLAVAACLTPTDPILAAAVVGGKYADKHVPAHLRHLLAAESGCNDGAAYPFLFIALYLIIDKTPGKAVSDWFLLLWLYQVILGIVMGALIGIGFRHLMKFCERKELIDRQSYVAQYISLAMLTIGSTSLLGSDDLLAAFACGTAFAWDGFFNKQTEESVFSSVIDLLFNVAVFVFVGAWMPFSTFADASLSLSVWRLVVIAILVLIVRRLPIIIALYRWVPDIKTFREAIFSGHFGPMGIGAIYISTLAAMKLPHAHHPPESQTDFLAATIQPIVAFMVLFSVAVHGLSIPFFSLGRRVHSVSRTWSRHDTLGRGGTMPEWANQTRTVVRGEDIVINRDRNIDVERGDTIIDEKVDIESRRGDSITEKGEGSSSEPEKSAAPSTHSHIKEDVREEVPPDGTETIAEWKEGPHRIIERRDGPGEEVQVEVQRNAFAPGETHTKTLRVHEDAAHETISDLRQKLSQAAEDVRNAGTHAQRSVRSEVDLAERKVEEVEANIKHRLSPRNRSESRNRGPFGDEEEEGWMSDQSAEEGERGSSKQGERGRKSPKSKPPKINVSRPLSSSSRRRHSFRRVITGRPLAQTPRTLSDDGTEAAAPSDGSDDEGRGRRRSLLRDSPLTPQTSRSLRHHRIDSLISPGSRELSPARSVRWADDPETGRPSSSGGTPKVLSPLPPATPLPGSEAPTDDEEDSPYSQKQVSFDIPQSTEHLHVHNARGRHGERT
ncbi:Sodium/hydrogen exchanger family-domain-containing protein [Cristinia sonorae]|uniref:Sodium/hydrogen exchanger family-domain-containing protein n=1 Tax=Cristinia sonorae TaxID=1940300 RepID=A0A8K0UUP8_9AGAR|nr:Sodium/hydrogen exchanger family-domain-containing protein [Cristinia sonorae]